MSSTDGHPADPTTIAIRHEQVRRQIDRTRAEYGPDFDAPFRRHHFAFLDTLFDGLESAERLLLIELLDRVRTAVTDDDGDRGPADRVARAAAHSG